MLAADHDNIYEHAINTPTKIIRPKPLKSMFDMYTSDLPHLLIWIDLETTGLDPKWDEILEIGCIATDITLNHKLKVNSTFHEIIEWHRTSKSLDPIVQEMHTVNGLFNECKEANKSEFIVDMLFTDWLIDLQQATEATLLIQAGATPHFDREFIRLHFPTAFEVLDYHLIDVSTLLYMARNWFGYQVDQPTSVHRAIPDVIRAINLARAFYPMARLPFTKEVLE